MIAFITEFEITIAPAGGHRQADIFAADFWANAVIDAIHDERGKLVGFAKITRDITERRNAQNAPQETQLQLAHAQKMDASEQLTGGVAHDFNNLLMVVSGHIQTINRAVDDPKAGRAAATRRGQPACLNRIAVPFRPRLRSETDSRSKQSA